MNKQKKVFSMCRKERKSEFKNMQRKKKGGGGGLEVTALHDGVVLENGSCSGDKRIKSVYE